MKFNFKKIASALTSTVLVGSTVALAAAASYPAPFVENGAADVAVVYGSDMDMAAVTDITTSLSSALTGAAAGASTDAYGLFTTQSPLLLNKSINSVKTTVSASNMPNTLESTSFSGNVDATATFTITPGSNPKVMFAKQPTSSDDPNVVTKFSTSSGNYLYNASVAFNKAVNFTHADSKGEEITLFGQEFMVASATDSTNLVLFKSAKKVFLTAGGSSPNPSEVVQIAGETYTVDLVSASDTAATIKVTDSTGDSDQKEINEDASKKIGGIEVAISTADENTALSEISANVIIGASRVKFTDGNSVKLGTDETVVEGTKVGITGTNAMNALTKLTVSVYAASGSEDALVSGDEFVDPVFGNFRMILPGLTIETDDTDNRETISIDASGNDKMTVGLTNWQGNSITSFEWLNNESRTSGSQGAFLADSEEQDIVIQEMGLINKSDYAILGNEENGYLVKLSSITNDTTVSTTGSGDGVTFTNVFDTGQSWDATITSEGSGTIDIGGRSYTVNYVYDKVSGEDSAAYVRLQWDQDSTGQDMILYPTVETEKGANFAFYEPLIVNVSSWDGSNTLIGANIKLPNGNGYTDVAITGAAAADAVTDGSFGIGGTAINSTAGHKTVSIGQLTYNFTYSAGNTTKIFLVDPSGGNVVNPGIVIFEESDTDNNYEAMIIQTSGAGDSNNGIGVSDVDFTWNNDADMVDGSAYGASGFQRETSDKLYDMMDVWGTLVTTDQSTSDQYTVVVSYPDEQVSAELYFDAISAGEATSLGSVSVMDTELASSGLQSRNLIVVGGSCVNSVAASLLGSSSPMCGSSWTAATGAGSGQYVVQTFNNPNAGAKVATLVAGWAAGDTQNAATYLRTQSVDTSVGMKYKGTTGTSASLVTE